MNQHRAQHRAQSTAQDTLVEAEAEVRVRYTLTIEKLGAAFFRQHYTSLYYGLTLRTEY